ncbi:MAG TPA: cytochrome C oxidase subunit IV family protein, partial [Candidatus Binatus sp.]|nr:cytochrome C oxidase subunit IV family protein [Candidatus Binatus sp.]
MTETHVPLRIYYTVYGALLVLTVVTVGVSLVDLGPLSTVVALAIAAAKASLVILFFMHVRYGP